MYEQLREHGFGHSQSESGRHQLRAHAERFQYFQTTLRMGRQSLCACVAL
uniref:Uncharacterized protein n=1 Tax=Globisporangium ultimum (strain ATCC 200006 / CBS 805.95 / DAOM BR144) TaxID=431595 RepID=K3WQY0_GLOUD